MTALKTSQEHPELGKMQVLSRQHQLSLHTPLPSQNVCLTVRKNKIQLINLIWFYLREHHHLLSQNVNALVATGSQQTSTEISNGKVQDCHDLRTTHEEAGVIIIQQVVHLAEAGYNRHRENCRIDG